MSLRHPYRWALAGVLAVVTALAVGVAAAHPSADPGGAAAGRGGAASLAPASDRQHVPDFTGIVRWINSPPLTRAELRGKVVLIDFWTFSCVNCVRTIPHLRALYDTYRDRGLVIVGVHSPEFDFEKDPDNVAAAVRRLGVTWPVAVDSSMATWNAFGNQYWPAEYLVDPQGRIADFHAGEGEYDVTERAVVALLGGGATSAPVTVGAVPGSNTTPELYAGSARGTLGDGEAYGAQGARVAYPDPGVPRARDLITVAGTWVDRVEYLEAATPGHVRLRFHASDLYVVGGSATGAPLRLGVSLDGAPVPAALGGPELDLDAGGLTITGPDLRHVLRGVGPGDHLLDLAVPAGFRLYTVTFG